MLYRTNTIIVAVKLKGGVGNNELLGVGGGVGNLF